MLAGVLKGGPVKSRLVVAAAVSILSIVGHSSAGTTADADNAISSFFDAIEQGDQSRIDALLAEPDFASRVDSDGHSPIIVAAYLDDAVLVGRLLSMHADADYRDPNGWNALCFAAARGATESAKILIVKHEDISSETCGSIGLLNLTASYGHDEVLKELIDSGANIEFVNNAGVTPLVLAVLKRHVAAAEVLLNAGADPNVKVNGKALSEIVTKGGSAEMVALFQKFTK